MYLRIEHKTRYRFAQPVHYGLQQLRLVPKSRAGQSVLQWDILLEGGRKEVEYDDHHNNRTWLISLDTDVVELQVICRGEVDTTDQAGLVGEDGGFAPLWYFRRQTALTKPGPGIRSLTRELSGAADTVTQLHALSELIAGRVNYTLGHTAAATPAEEAFQTGHGVCQDHAHIFIAAARLLGYPARYVSGYLLLADGVTQDAGHGWAEVYVDQLGWVGFDVSNGISPDERYVRVATGLDYAEAAPVSGITVGENEDEVDVHVAVQQQ